MFVKPTNKTKGDSSPFPAVDHAEAAIPATAATAAAATAAAAAAAAARETLALRC